MTLVILTYGIMMDNTTDLDELLAEFNSVVFGNYVETRNKQKKDGEPDESNPDKNNHGAI